MYVESKEKFNWFDFFARAMVVVVFVFLLMWLVPLPSVKKVEVKVDKLEEQVSVITDRIFYDNLINMKEASFDYFTIAKLPKKVDDTVKITLKDMLDKKLILEFKDKNGNSCDVDASYVEVKRLENEYEVKTYLKCDDIDDYILTYMDLVCGLSCDDSCKLTDSEESKNYTEYTLYQYKKDITTTGYTSWSNWTTDVKKSDEVRTKKQVKGKKWVENLVYEYEHTKVVKEDDKEVVTKEEDKVVEVWVPKEEKTCTRREKVAYDAKIEYTDTERQCKKVATGTTTNRVCDDTCVLKTETVYEKVCEDVEVTKTRIETKYRTEYVSYDCSIEGYFTTKTIIGNTITTIVPGNTNTVTIWTLNEVEDGYTYTGNKRVKEDNGYYVYTKDWADTLESGYTLIEERTLYSYRDKVTNTKTIYKWDKSNSLNDGWVLTGKTKVEKVEVK